MFPATKFCYISKDNQDGQVSRFLYPLRGALIANMENVVPENRWFSHNYMNGLYFRENYKTFKAVSLQISGTVFDLKSNNNRSSCSKGKPAGLFCSHANANVLVSGVIEELTFKTPEPVKI